MSSSKRYSTIHDHSSLRLRPDGSRVTRKQTEGKSQKYSTYTVKDHRGNWIAKDAGGIGYVKTRYAARKEAEGEGRESEEQVESDEARESKVTGSSTAKRDKGKERALEIDLGGLKDSRAKRRRLFLEDIGTRDAEPPSISRSSAPLVSEGAESVVPKDLHARPSPSSDLLKCIHYFASTYYSEMGQLRDSSKEYRREKKLRRLKKLERLAARTAARLRPGLQQNHDAQDEDNEAGSSKDDISDTDEESSVGKVKKVSKRRQAKPLVGTDMYKIFDGSALMTIGMLLQHHIEDLVASRIPEGWEQEMQCEAEQPKREIRHIKRVRNNESEDYAASSPFLHAEEPLDDFLIDGILSVHDDSEDEDYVPQ